MITIEFQVKYIDLDTGERIAYREAGRASGDKPTVLILHGNMSSSYHMQGLMEGLCDKYKVYAMDMVGFGDSSYNRELNSCEDFSKDVTAFIEKMDLDNIHILGWSMGGGVAIETAVDNQDKIKQIFLLSSVGVQGYPLYKRDSLLGFDLKSPLFLREDLTNDPVLIKPAIHAFEIGHKNFFKALLNKWMYHNNRIDDLEYDKLIDATLKQRNILDVNVALTNFNVTTSSNDVNEGSGRLYHLRMPITIMHGTDDKVVDIDLARASKDFIGQRAELIEFDGGSHSLFTDDRDEIVNIVKERIDLLIEKEKEEDAE